MLKNFFIIASRILVRNKTFTFINVLSLSIAIALCIVAYSTYIFKEEFNSHHVNRKNIFRINSKNEVARDIIKHYGLSPQVFDSLIDLSRRNIPISRFHRQTLNIKDKNDQLRLYWSALVDSSFFDIFTFPLKNGSFENFSQGNKVYFSPETAKECFGNENPIGKHIKINVKGYVEDYEVAGVFHNIPKNNSFPFQLLIPYFDVTKQSSLPVRVTNGTIDGIFLLIEDENKKRDVLNRMSCLENVQTNNTKYVYTIQSFTDMQEMDDESGDSPFIRPVAGQWERTSGMAALILLLAMINFTNSVIVLSTKRLKEIGVRKVVGASRKNLIVQILGENFLLIVTAFVLSLAFAELFIKIYNSWWGYITYYVCYSHLKFYVFIGLLIGVITIVSGAYPALFISSYNPIVIFKGRKKFGRNVFIKSLTLIQFIITTFLLVSLTVYWHNEDFYIDYDRGYSHDGLISFLSNSPKAYQFVRSLTEKEFLVERIAGSNSHVGFLPDRTEVTSNELTKNVIYYDVDSSYIKTIDMKFLNTLHSTKHDSALNKIYVNETFCKEFGIKNPQQSNIILNGKVHKIHGVVKDFYEYILSTSRQISPVVIQITNKPIYNFLSIKTQEKNSDYLIKKIKQEWTKQFPYDRLIIGKHERFLHWEKYVTQILLYSNFYLSIIAIIISIIGLYSLVALSVVKRTKEIGIRKTFGASKQNIISIINKDYLPLMIIAFTLGSVLAVFISNYFLSTVFINKAEFSVISILFPLIVIAVVVVLTIGYKIYKAININPIEYLHDE